MYVSKLSRYSFGTQALRRHGREISIVNRRLEETTEYSAHYIYFAMFVRFDADMSIKKACCPLFTSPVGGNVKCKWEKAFNIYYSQVHINTALSPVKH